MAERRRRRLHLRARVLVLTSVAVVIALLVLGGALITVLSHSLYDQQRREALSAVQRVTLEINQSLGAAPPASTPTPTSGTTQPADPLVTARNLVESTEPATGFDFLLVGPNSAPSSDPRLSVDTVPTELVRAVSAQQLSYVYVPSPLGSGSALVVGTPVGAGTEGACAPKACQAYFYFPLTFQQHTIALVAKILITVGAVLLVCIVALAVVSIGRVLEPVRSARDAAARVAAGDLSARMAEASSKDDFGRLAESFNRMADVLSQKIGELEQLSRLQARFVSDVSHELRTPLATVRMAADYIHAARDGLPPDAQRAAILLQRELERFENLLEDLLEISRFDARVIVLDPVVVDIAVLQAEVLDMLEAVAHGRRVDVSLEIDRREGAPLVAADRRRLERVFTNLVKNAIEHTTDGGVRVAVSRTRTTVLVRVSDDGEGIPPEDLPHIFERFYRADPHRARTHGDIGGGTGLGLAIALENVRLHGGSIEVSSEVGKGSEFVVRLPALPAALPEPQQPPAPVREEAPVGG